MGEGNVSFDFRSFVGAVSIHGVREVFSEFSFSCPCGAVGFPLRAESLGVRVVGGFSFGNVSFDLL